MTRWLTALVLCAFASTAASTAASDDAAAAADTQMIKTLSLAFLKDRSEGDRRRAWENYDQTVPDNDDFAGWAGMIGGALGMVEPPYRTTITGVSWQIPHGGASGDTVARAFYRSFSQAGGLFCGHITWRKQPNGSYKIATVSNVIAMTDASAGSPGAPDARDPDFQAKHCPPTADPESDTPSSDCAAPAYLPSGPFIPRRCV